MMKPEQNRRGCLLFVLFGILALAAILLLLREAPPTQGDRGPPPPVQAPPAVQP